jgi:hypothetical protein
MTPYIGTHLQSDYNPQPLLFGPSSICSITHVSVMKAEALHDIIPFPHKFSAA